LIRSTFYREKTVRTPSLAISLAVLCAAAPTQADTFQSSAQIAFLASPGNWRWVGVLPQPQMSMGYGVVYNPAVSTTRELILPLFARTSSGNWTATVDAGGDLVNAANPITCTLYVVGQGEILCGSGPQQGTSPVGTITMTVASSATSTTAFIDCAVPGQAWIGNVTWTTP
jgi:hypothetical protein